MSGFPDINERVAVLEKEAEKIPALESKIAALERFQIMVMTGLAAVGAVLTFFADTIRKKIGWS